MPRRRGGRRGGSTAGTFLSPIVKAIANACIRQTMVQAGLKKQHRGGNRQGIWRRMVDPPHSKRKEKRH